MQTLVREDGRTLDPEDLRPKACKHTVVWVVNMSSARVIRVQCPTCAATGAHRTEGPPMPRFAVPGATRLTEMKQRPTPLPREPRSPDGEVNEAWVGLSLGL